MKKFILSCILFASALYAESTGSASIFIFLNDIPLEHNEVLIDGEYSDYTDEDGVAEVILDSGEHQIEIFAKDKQGRNLGYARKNIVVKDSKDTQVIATFNGENANALIDVDTPLGDEEAQKVASGFGQLSGTITSLETSKPITNARIFLKGSSVTTRTDENGHFSIEIPADQNVSISVVHSEFSSQTLNNLVVAQGESLEKAIALVPASMELEEFVVLAPQVQGSISALIQEEKKSDSITNIIGSEQMKKQGDSNAASALKRVAGITLMDGKYIYVRGLGDRYSATELNSMSLPSPNPIKRTVPLDLFPSSVIGSLQVQKSFTPDITGAFGGGYVNIRTKKAQKEDYAKLKLGTKVHDTFGKDVTSYQGSSSDDFGYDDGYREFNENFVSNATPTITQPQPSITQTPQEMQSMLTKRSLNKVSTTVPFGTELSLEASKNFKIADGHEISVFGTYGYSSEAMFREYTSYDYIISSSGQQYDTPDNTAVNNFYRYSIKHGGMVNLSYNYNDVFNIAYTKLYVINSLQQTRDIYGTFGENNSDENRVYYEWQERELNIDQITGSLLYKLYLPNEFSFGFESATANEFVPNDIEYNYIRRPSSSPYTFKRNESQLTYNRRETDDELINGYLKNKTNIDLFSDADFIEIGGVIEDKTRVGRQQKLRVQSNISDNTINESELDTILNYGDGSSLNYDLTSRPKDDYDATFKRQAFYLNTSLQPFKQLNVSFGARKESVTQSVDQYTVENSVVTTTNNTLDIDKLLPSLTMKYSFNDSNILKFAYGETYIYPDFREFVDSEFIHPVFLAKISGNPDLVETDIQSIDMRYEHYFNESDNISTAIFYKNMDNPIEDTREFTTSTLPRFSFDNAQSATLYGLELSWFKNLGFIYSGLDRFTFFGNYTYIVSDVTLTEEQKEKYVTQERGLQGLSPQVINLSFMYQDNERSLNLAYNKMSERLMRVALKNGDVVLGLDEYEEPPHLLDFTWIEKFKIDAINTEMDMTFKVKNILDGETTWRQDDKTTLKYKTGREYSISLSAKI